ncbi:hypothetical protein C4D60_Mb07t01020 [Musa balbisiana]|uniref:Uncharacterized protein n=1 Tax=Musa balbisiana TaxID=52838 RepID=A0A4S8JC81_MUSBA|nr:hypothetical protein C4D60_Mb07t01020 [Musa balbisiana]
MYKSQSKYKHHHHCSTDCFRAAGRGGSARAAYGERAARLLILSASLRIRPKMHELPDNRGKCLGFPPAAAGYDPLSYARNVDDGSEGSSVFSTCHPGSRHRRHGR